MDNSFDPTNETPLIFIVYRDEGWMVSCPSEETHEEGLGMVLPPMDTFEEAIDAAADLGDSIAGGNIIISLAAAKVAIRELHKAINGKAR